MIGMMKTLYSASKNRFVAPTFAVQVEILCLMAADQNVGKGRKGRPANIQSFIVLPCGKQQQTKIKGTTEKEEKEKLKRKKEKGK